MDVTGGDGAAFGIFGEAVGDKAVDAGGDGVGDADFDEAVGEGLGFGVADLVFDVALAERWRAGEKLVKGRAEGVDVVGGTGCLAIELLGAHEGERAPAEMPGGGALVGVAEVYGDAKVGQFQNALVVDEHVGRLEIAVDNTFFVGVAQSAAEIAENGAQIVPGKDGLGLLLAEVVKVDALDVFHGDEGEFAGEVVKVVDADDVGVREFATLEGFEAEVFEGAFVDALGGVKEFEGDGFAEHGVGRKPDFAGTTAPEAFEQHISAGSKTESGIQADNPAGRIGARVGS